MVSVKVLWKNHLVEGATWDVEADKKSRYPYQFDDYGYLVLLIMKIMTKIEVALILCDVLQKCAFYGFFTVKCVFHLKNLQFFLF